MKNENNKYIPVNANQPNNAYFLTKEEFETVSKNINNSKDEIAEIQKSLDESHNKIEHQKIDLDNQKSILKTINMLIIGVLIVLFLAALSFIWDAFKLHQEAYKDFENVLLKNQELIRQLNLNNRNIKSQAEYEKVNSRITEIEKLIIQTKSHQDILSKRLNVIPKKDLKTKNE